MSIFVDLMQKRQRGTGERHDHTYFSLTLKPYILDAVINGHRSTYDTGAVGQV